MLKETLLSEKLDESINWKSFLDTILGQLGTHFAVEISSENITIETDPVAAKEITNRLTSVLSNPTAFQRSLPYKLVDQSNSSQTPTELGENTDFVLQTPPIPDNSIDTGKQVLLNIFSENLLDELMNINSLFNEKTGAKSEEKVLFSKPASRITQLGIWNAIIEDLVSYFADVNLDKLREVWNNEDSYLSTPEIYLVNSETSTGIKIGLIEQCFGIQHYPKTDNNPESDVFYFDYGRLYEFIFPPQVTISENKSDEGIVELNINKEHILSCVQQLTQGGMLFRTYKNAKEVGKIKMRPIFLSRERAVEKPALLSLVIDRSGSMCREFSDLKNHIISFISAIADRNKDITIRLSFFSDQLDTPVEFHISALDEIIEYMKEILAVGHTLLFDSISSEISHSLIHKSTNDYNVSLIVFTDGQDNESKPGAEKNLTNEMLKFDQRSLERPKVFTLGYGKEYQHESLVKLTKSMDQKGSHIHLQELDDFYDIFVHVKEITCESDLINFLLQVEESTQEFSIPLYHSNEPTLPSIIIPTRENSSLTIQMGDKKMIVSIPDSSLVPVENFTDRLTEILIEMRRIVADRLKTPQDKVTELLFLQADAESLMDSQERVIADEKITYWQHQLQRAYDDEKMHKSIMSRALHQQGFQIPDEDTVPSRSISSIYQRQNSPHIFGGGSTRSNNTTGSQKDTIGLGMNPSKAT